VDGVPPPPPGATARASPLLHCCRAHRGAAAAASDRGTGHAAGAAERHSDAVVRVAEVPLAAVVADATALGDLMLGNRVEGLVAAATGAGGNGPGRGRIPRMLATLLGVGTGAHGCMW